MPNKLMTLAIASGAAANQRAVRLWGLMSGCEQYSPKLPLQHTCTPPKRWRPP